MMMTKNEALKAAIDGKKIRPTKETPIEYVYFHCGNFIIKWDNGARDYGVPSYADWEIVPEYVDFAEALKAYRNSATIKSVTGEKYSLKREDETLCVNLKEIEGKWLILEDE